MFYLCFRDVGQPTILINLTNLTPVVDVPNISPLFLFYADCNYFLERVADAEVKSHIFPAEIVNPALSNGAVGVM